MRLEKNHWEQEMWTLQSETQLWLNTKPRVSTRDKDKYELHNYIAVSTYDQLKLKNYATKRRTWIPLTLVNQLPLDLYVCACAKVCIYCACYLKHFGCVWFVHKLNLSYGIKSHLNYSASKKDESISSGIVCIMQWEWVFKRSRRT